MGGDYLLAHRLFAVDGFGDFDDRVRLKFDDAGRVVNRATADATGIAERARAVVAHGHIGVHLAGVGLTRLHFGVVVLNQHVVGELHAARLDLRLAEGEVDVAAAVACRRLPFGLLWLADAVIHLHIQPLLTAREASEGDVATAVIDRPRPRAGNVARAVVLRRFGGAVVRPREFDRVGRQPGLGRNQHRRRRYTVGAVVDGGGAAPGKQHLGADVRHLAAGDGDGAGAVVEGAAAVSRRAAAQGAGAVIAQVVPATLRAVAHHQRAGGRHRQNGHAVVVAAVVDGDTNAGGICHLQKFCRRAEVQRPPAISDRLGKAQLASGVIHRTDRPVAAVEGAAAVVDGHGADDEADAAGGDGVARIQHRRVVERHIARQHALAAGGVKDELLLPGGGEVGERGLHLRGGDEFLHQRRHAQRLHPGLDRRRQRLDAVILGAVGDMRLAQLARRVGITDGRVINADKIGRQRGGQLQFDHGAHKILAAGHIRKGAVKRRNADNLNVLLHLRVAELVLPQTIDIPHLWQWLVGALVGLDDATAEALRGE